MKEVKRQRGQMGKKVILEVMGQSVLELMN